MKNKPPKIHNSKDMYRAFKKKHPDIKMKYWLFKEILARHNKKSVWAVAKGGTLDLKHGLGHLRIKKTPRDFKKPIVDWKETKKYKKELLEAGKTLYNRETNPEGEKYMIYFSDDFYLRWKWVTRGVGKTRNQRIYDFIPTSNKSRTAEDTGIDKLGAKGILTYCNKQDPLLHHRYNDI